MPARRKCGKRSKAGCMTCRLGRKKCDEIKPTCSLCLKRNTKCIWPEAPSSLNRFLDKNKSTEMEVALTKKIIRTRLGCLQCKKDRKKCDENKPVCIRCEKRNVICEWPDLFDINKIDKDPIIDKNITNSMITKYSPPPSSSSSSSSFSSSSSPPPLSQSEIIEVYNSTPNDVNINTDLLKRLNFTNTMTKVGLINGFFNTVINLLTFNSSVEVLSDLVFDSLKTSAEFQKIITSYSSSVINRRYVEERENSYDDTNQSLCIILGLENSDYLLELKLNAIIYSILKLLMKNNSRIIISNYVKIGLNLILMYVPKRPNFRLKVMIESIVYNFAASFILRSNDSIDEMNPFIICDRIKNLFTTDSTIDTKNSILGESFDTFIITAKVSYLFKKNSYTQEIYDSLMNEINSYLISHPSLIITSNNENKNMPIFLTKYIVLLACKLLLLYLNGEGNGLIFNNIIDELFIILKTSTSYRVEMIKYGYWGVFMFGLNLKTKFYRDFLVNYFVEMFDENKDVYYIKGCESLKYAWKRDIGFDILRDESFLNVICMN